MPLYSQPLPGTQGVPAPESVGRRPEINRHEQVPELSREHGPNGQSKAHKLPRYADSNSIEHMSMRMHRRATMEIHLQEPAPAEHGPAPGPNRSACCRAFGIRCRTCGSCAKCCWVECWHCWRSRSWSHATHALCVARAKACICARNSTALCTRAGGAS